MINAIGSLHLGSRELSSLCEYPSFRGIKARIKEPYDYTGRGYRTDSDKRSSHVTTYLEGENKILINKSGKSSSSPAGISVAKGAKLTIDSEPEQQGSIEVLNNTKVSKTGAAIGGNVGQDTGIIHIKGGTVIAK